MPADFVSVLLVVLQFISSGALAPSAAEPAAPRSADAAPSAVAEAAPTPKPTATCRDHPNQASAQRAKDTRDGDGDGIYCESLPCPCASPDEDGGGDVPDRPAQQPREACVRTDRVLRIRFSKREYPGIWEHYRTAVAAGWPRILVLNRDGADARRQRLLSASFPTKDGYDRDEYPPAIGRGRGEGLERGTHPTGWRASVAYVKSSENRSHGSVLGSRLANRCDGQRFEYAFE